MVYIKDKGLTQDATKLQTRLRAPFAALAQILGPPDKVVPEKCSTAWKLRNENITDNRVVLKDTQDEDDASFSVSKFRGLPSYDWEVRAADKETATRFCRWLSAQVIDVVRSVRTLDAAGKARLNELLRSGVPLNEAMKSVTLVSSQNAATQFAWPIRDKGKAATVRAE